MCQVRIGIEFDSLSTVFHGLRQTTAANAREGEDDVRIARQWVNFIEPQKLITAFLIAPRNPLQKEQTIPGPSLWIIRIELERLLKLPLREVEVQVVKQSSAREGAVGLGEIRFQLECSSRRLQRAGHYLGCQIESRVPGCRVSVCQPRPGLGVL